MMNKDYIRILPLELKNILKLFLGYVVALFIKEKSPLWLISERGTDARDNAYTFFVWLKKYHPEINVKYIISSSAKDYSKLFKYKDSIVRYDSFDHYKKIWQATNLISTHICGYRPNIQCFSELDRRFNILKNKKKIFLQHGIIKGNLIGLYAKNVHLDMFVCGARPEYDYVKSNFGYSSNVVQYTGLCRFDNLLNFEKKKQILIMPTWRMYVDRHHFSESLYFKTYKALLTSKRIQSLAIEYGYKIVFYPHYEFQPFIKDFKDVVFGDNIVVADMSYDVQTLLKESAILVTDYSSVYFDFAFMHKPIVFYQFDQDDFYSKHYAKGYIDESKIGRVVTNLCDCEKELEEILKRNCRVEDVYLKNIDTFFEKRDENNSQRVFNAIIRIKK